MQELHRLNIAHRDIKIENLMFMNSSDDPIKLGDFGLARQLDADLPASTPCGTKEWMAPEMFERSPQYTKAVDVWALGCLIFVVLFGRFPFFDDEDARTGANIPNIRDKIRRGDFSFPRETDDGGQVSAEARDIISKCLTVDARRRLTIDQVLQHPWLATKRPSTLPLLSPQVMRSTRDFVSLRDIVVVSTDVVRGDADAAASRSSTQTPVVNAVLEYRNNMTFKLAPAPVPPKSLHKTAVTTAAAKRKADGTALKDDRVEPGRASETVPRAADDNKRIELDMAEQDDRMKD